MRLTCVDLPEGLCYAKETILIWVVVGAVELAVRDEIVVSIRRGAERGLADPLAVLEVSFLAGFCPADETTAFFGVDGSENVGDEAVGPIWFDLTNAPTGNVDVDVVVLTGIEESLSELAFTRKACNKTDPRWINNGSKFCIC